MWALCIATDEEEFAIVQQRASKQGFSSQCSQGLRWRLRAERIAQIRRHRLLSLKESRSTDYIDPRLITDELILMKKICSNNDWPMIDVTRRSVEETAATILNMLSDTKRLDKQT